MGRLSKRQAAPNEGDIDMSPLIDMVFILLIFFVVSTTFIKDAKLELDRPSAQSATTAPSKSLRVYIDRDAKVYVDEVAVRPWMIQSRVREIMQRGSSESVLVVSDRTVPVEKLIEVVDQIRLAGIQDVGVITDSEEG